MHLSENYIRTRPGRPRRTVPYVTLVRRNRAAQTSSDTLVNPKLIPLGQSDNLAVMKRSVTLQRDAIAHLPTVLVRMALTLQVPLVMTTLLSSPRVTRQRRRQRRVKVSTIPQRRLGLVPLGNDLTSPTVPPHRVPRHRTQVSPHRNLTQLGRRRRVALSIPFVNLTRLPLAHTLNRTLSLLPLKKAEIFLNVDRLNCWYSSP